MQAKLKATNAFRAGALLLCSWICSPIFAQTYVISEIGTLGGTNSAAYAINRSGVVAGFASDTNENRHAIAFENDALRDLGSLGGSNSVATALSLTNQFVGWANPADSRAQHAFLSVGGVLTDLNGFLAGSTNSIAHGVNLSGNVAGEYQTARGRQRPFLYANGIAIDLGFDGAALCVNDGGQIGGYELRDGKLGFVITGGRRQYVGTLGSNDTQVVGLNTNGLAVGTSLTSAGQFRAFTFLEGKLFDLGTLGGTLSEALAVNNAGHVVGRSADASGQMRAFLYANGEMVDLNSLITTNSSWTLTVAHGINDAGQVVGAGEYNGQPRGFVLTPNFVSLALYPGLTIRGKLGRTYRVDYLDSVDPANTWQTLTNLVLETSPLFYVDPRPIVFGRRYYRSVLLP